MRRRMHLQVETHRHAACGEPIECISITPYAELVSCRRCRRSSRFREMKAEYEAKRAAGANTAEAVLAQCRALINNGEQK